MARDNSPKIRQRAQLTRKENQRESYDRVLIVSEGSKTEPLYFTEIRSTYRLHTANVVVRPSAAGTEPAQVVQYAMELFEKGDPHRRIRARAFERVYAIFDRDDHRTYFEALRAASELDRKLRNDLKKPVIFRAVPSIPSFELWLLLHYEDIQHALHRDEALRRLRGHIPNYAKGAGGSFAATAAQLDVATQRARRLAARYDATNGAEPYTGIFELVDLLLSFKA